jgi:hypothetical protein
MIDLMTPITLAGTSRQYMIAVPFLVTGALILLTKPVLNDSKITKYTIGVILFLVILSNVAAYPAGLLGNENLNQDEYSRLLTYQQKRAFDWIPPGSNVVAATKARIYLESSNRANVIEDQYVYAGNDSKIQPGTLVLLRSEYRRVAYMRTHEPFQYAIPDGKFSRFNNVHQYYRIYANGDVEMHHRE